MQQHNNYIPCDFLTTAMITTNKSTSRTPNTSAAEMPIPTCVQLVKDAETLVERRETVVVPMVTKINHAALGVQMS